MSDLSEVDMEAVGAAVRILNEAGFDVEKANHAKSEEHGVSFKLKCHAPTRSQFFGPQLEAVKEEAIEAPEFDMGGNPVESND